MRERGEEAANPVSQPFEQAVEQRRAQRTLIPRLTDDGGDGVVYRRPGPLRAGALQRRLDQRGDDDQSPSAIISMSKPSFRTRVS